MTRRSVLAVVVLVVAVGGLAALAQHVRGDGTRADPGSSVQVERARRDWPDWAATRLHAGQPRSPLVSATGRLGSHDWGVPPTFEWRLTFRSDEPVSPRGIERTFRRACAFAPARALGAAVTARLVAPGMRAVVATEVSTDCDDSYERVSVWLDHLAAHPLPRQVRNASIKVLPDELVDVEGRLVVQMFVRSSDATRAVAQSIRRHYCAFRGRRGTAVYLRPLGPAVRRPPVDEPVLAGRPVDPHSCAMPA